MPGRKPVIFVMAAFAFVLGWFGLRHPLLGVAGAGIILGATADYWLGSKFRLDATGARAQTGLSVTTMAWEDVRRILIKGREVRLSPLPEKSPLDTFRGVGLTTTKTNFDAVMAFIRARVAAETPEEAMA